MPQDREEPKQFGLPQGYFEQSARLVLNRVEWLEEQQAFPGLVPLQKDKAFAVPFGYFERNRELLPYPALLALKKQQPFALPPGYFEAAEISALAKALKDEAPVLAFIPKQQPFKVEDAYFAGKAAQLQHMLSAPAAPARILPLFSQKTWRLAAAAMLVAALGFWIYQANRPVEELKDCGTIACIDRLELLKSRSIESLDADDLYDLVNSNALEKKLQDKDQPFVAPATDSMEDGWIEELPDGI